MQSKLAIALTAAFLATGCAIKMADPQASSQAKQFKAPSPGKAGVYVYRNSEYVGGALKKDVWVNGQCLGGLMTRVFFYTEVPANQKHRIDTDAEFSQTNGVEISAKAGQLYFVRQFMKIGVFSGRADLELMPEAQGKTDIGFLDLGAGADCSTPTQPGASAAPASAPAQPPAASAPAPSPASATTPTKPKRSKKTK